MSDWDRLLTRSGSSSDSFTPFETPGSVQDARDAGRGFREGLPPAFRMRADAHYVEQLDASAPAMTVQYIAVHAIDTSDARPVEPMPSLVESIKRHGVLEPLIVQRQNGTYRTLAGYKRLAAARAAGLREVPCIVHHVREEDARALKQALSVKSAPPPAVQGVILPVYENALSQSLATLVSCAGLLAPTTSQLTRSVAVDLVQAEVRRATCLLQMTRVLRQGVRRGMARVFPGEMLRRVIEAIEPERRLRGVRVETAIDVDAGALRADQELLIGGLSSLLLSTMTLLETTPGARLVIAGTVEDDSRLVVAISQEVVTIEEPTDPATPAASGGPVDVSAAALSILALRRIAEAHDGRVLVLRPSTGTRVWMELPLEREL